MGQGGAHREPTHFSVPLERCARAWLEVAALLDHCARAWLEVAALLDHCACAWLEVAALLDHCACALLGGAALLERCACALLEGAAVLRNSETLNSFRFADAKALSKQWLVLRFCHARHSWHLRDIDQPITA